MNLREFFKLGCFHMAQTAFLNMGICSSVFVCGIDLEGQMNGDFFSFPVKCQGRRDQCLCTV